MTRIDEYINWLATLSFVAKKWLLVVVRLVAKIATGTYWPWFLSFPNNGSCQKTEVDKSSEKTKHEFVVTILYQVCTAICSHFVRVNFTCIF